MLIKDEPLDHLEPASQQDLNQPEKVNFLNPEGETDEEQVDDPGTGANNLEIKTRFVLSANVMNQK